MLQLFIQKNYLLPNVSKDAIKMNMSNLAYYHIIKYPLMNSPNSEVEIGHRIEHKHR